MVHSREGQLSILRASHCRRALDSCQLSRKKIHSSYYWFYCLLGMLTHKALLKGQFHGIGGASSCTIPDVYEVHAVGFNSWPSNGRSSCSVGRTALIPGLACALVSTFRRRLSMPLAGCSTSAKSLGSLLAPLQLPPSWWRSDLCGSISALNLPVSPQLSTNFSGTSPPWQYFQQRRQRK